LNLQIKCQTRTLIRFFEFHNAFIDLGSDKGNFLFEEKADLCFSLIHYETCGTQVSSAYAEKSGSTPKSGEIKIA
jgi:hypothetical protein